MADTKISALTGATTPLAGTEVVPIVQDSTTKNVSIANLTAGRQVDGLSFATTDLMKMIKTGSDTLTDGPYYYFNSGNINGDGVILQLNASNGLDIWQAAGAGWNKRFTFADGNLIQGTAAKGINFTANTPAAGMTSQLLNWYEEGTWTPVVSASSGTITSYTATGKYTRIGRSVVLSFKITITTNGTGSGTLFVDGVPYNAAATASDGGAGRESANTGYGFVMTFGTTSRLYVNKADASYPGANGDILAGTITYTV